MNDKEKLVLINQLTEEHKKNDTSSHDDTDSQAHLSHAVSFANTPEIVVDDKSQDHKAGGNNLTVEEVYISFLYIKIKNKIKIIIITIKLFIFKNFFFKKKKKKKKRN